MVRTLAILVVAVLVSLAPLAVLRWAGPGPVQGDVYLDVALEPVFPGLTFEAPVCLTHASDRTGRLYVAEARGTIRVFSSRADASRAVCFLDITDRVARERPGEGLLGLAFHPRFQENGRFFVHYTAGDSPRNVVSCFRVEPPGADRARPETETVVLSEPRPAGRRPGGGLVFGPDGRLYVGLGGDEDAGRDGSGRPGAIVRIDVDRGADGAPWRVPGVAAAVGESHGPVEVLAWMGRDPSALSVDPCTGGLWVGDGVPDEPVPIRLVSRERASLRSAPVARFSPDTTGSIAGGFVCRGRAAPALLGYYVYGDRDTGRVWALETDRLGVRAPLLLFRTGSAIACFGEDEAGELYACGGREGRIYRFTRKKQGD